MKKLINTRGSLVLNLADLCRHLPVGWLAPLSSAIGMFLYATRGGRRREVRKAYARLIERMGLPQSADELTREHFKRQFLILMANFILQDPDPAKWERIVHFEGLEPVVEKLRSGSGVLLTTLHFGSNLLIFTRLEQMGFGITVVRPAAMRNVTSPKERRILFIHGDTIYVGEAKGLGSPVRTAVKTLRKGNILGIALDGDQGGGLVGIPFIGGQYPLRVGGMEIAKMARVPMVFTLGAFKEGRLVVRLSPVWEFREDTDAAEFTERFIQAGMTQFEAMIREFPDCVWWTRPMSVAVGLKKFESLTEAGETGDE